MDSAKVQTTAWIRFKVEVEDGDGNVFRLDMVHKAFNSWMMEVFQGSSLNEVINKIFAHMRAQIKNPALANSKFMFDQVLFLDINFYQLSLTRGSSYLPLPRWILNKKAIINHRMREMKKWAIFIALHHVSIDLHPEQTWNLRRFEGSYDWTGLTFLITLSKISVFEWKNDVSVNILAIAGEKLYILRKAKFDGQRTVNLLLIANDEKRGTVL